MITCNEIIDTYLTSIGYRRVSGSSYEPILPFFMMDVVYDLYCHSVKPLPLRFQANHLRKEWARNYNKMNSKFFSCFSPEQAEEVINKMDSFTNYVSNYLVNVKVAIMNVVAKDASIDEQIIIADLMACNILCQSAQYIYMSVHRDNHGVKLRQPQIEAIQRLSHKLLNEYFRTGKNIDTNKDKAVSDAVSVLCKKMVGWLKLN